MAVNGTLLYIRRQKLPRVFNRLVFRAFRTRLKRRKKKHVPLAQKQWQDAFETESGRLIESDKIIKKIRNGGVESSVRAEVWPFLLNLYDLGSTSEEREAKRTLRREEYENLKRRCILLREKIAAKRFEDTGPTVSSLDPIFGSQTGECAEKSPRFLCTGGSGDMLFCQARESPHGNGDLPKQDSSASNSLHNFEKVEQGYTNAVATDEFIKFQRIIRLDAVRMNAEWVPYSPSQAKVAKGVASRLAINVGLKEDEHLEPCLRHHAARLVAILEAYALYDPETGYCQGMGDLLSPFVALLDEDYEAFWCFVCFMYTARENFRPDELGIWRQLQMVSKILKLGDPQLYGHLKKIQAADCFFIYRMVIVLLRRELSFEQTLSFWEILWADKTAVRLGKVEFYCRKRRKKAPPTDDLLLYVIAAAIRKERNFILEKCKAMDDVLKVCNGMTGQLDVWALLDDARGLIILLHDKFYA